MRTPPPPTSPPRTSSTSTIPLRLASGNGPITRLIQRTPPRDATPAEIPIIDAAGIFSPSYTDRLAVAQQIHGAATNTGFFYLINHGIPTTITNEAYTACLAFFRQDMAVKMRASATQSVYFNGYKPPRSQRINPFEGVDVRETFSWTYDPRLLDPDKGRMGSGEGGSLEDIPDEIRKFLRVEPDDPDGGAMRFPWSKTGSVPSFAPAVLAYWRASLGLARALLRAFALSLELEEGFFDAKFSHPDAALALNYYPPLQTAPVSSPAGAGEDNGEEKQVSIGSHTDFQLFTILWQDNVGGLEVLNRAGQWVRARPVDGAVVVNIADYLERVTNGRYQSTVHRAVNRSGWERVSMPFFFGFNLNESCGVVESCVGEDGVRLYEEVGCLEWVRRRVEAMHDTKAAKEEGQEGNARHNGIDER